MVPKLNGKLVKNCTFPAKEEFMWKATVTSMNSP